MHTTYKPEGLVMPLVHINGTSAESLLEMREEAYLAIGEAITALQDMAPNARDYYPYNQPDVFNGAIEQYRRRLRLLNELQDELTAECEHISQYKR